MRALEVKIKRLQNEAKTWNESLREGDMDEVFDIHESEFEVSA